MLERLFVFLVDIEPMPLPVIDDSYNSPGTLGFIVTFSVGVIAVLMFFDMNRRIRRTKFRTEIRERLANEQLDAIDPSQKPERPEPPTRPSRPANPQPDSD
jgi:hypothetical protein